MHGTSHGVYLIKSCYLLLERKKNGKHFKPLISDMNLSIDEACSHNLPFYNRFIHLSQAIVKIHLSHKQFHDLVELEKVIRNANES